MVGQQQLEDAVLGVLRVFRDGVDDHVGGHGRRARRLEPRQLFDLHQTHAAGADRLQALLVAEDGNLFADELGGFDEQHALGRFDVEAVNGELDGIHRGRCHHVGYGHLWSLMCCSYSPLNCFTVATTGEVAKSPRAQSTFPEICPESESSSSRSPGTPRPASMRVRILNSHEVPSRHGVHLPHDSWRKKSSMSAAARTMHVSSSSTISDADPSIEPDAWTES